MERPEFALNTRLPQKKRSNLYVPTDNDVKRLMTAVEGTEMELPILLAAFNPMRRSEICALDSSNINGDTVHILQNMVLTAEHKWTIKVPNTYAGD